MKKDELRKRLINIKAIADYEKEDPFVGIFFEDLFELFEEHANDVKNEVISRASKFLDNNLLDYWSRKNADSSDFIQDFCREMKETA